MLFTKLLSILALASLALSYLQHSPRNNITPRLTPFDSNPILKRATGYDYASTKTRGVNLGGWLVLEPWITPSIFQAQDGSVVDEWTLCEKVPNAASILKKHWDSWVILDDFKKIAGTGINLVRIPIGYWAFQKFNDPYIQGAAPYLDKAIEWARATGLKVIIDVHGAPGSQNGFDNSGRRTNSPSWTQGDTTKQLLNVIGQIAKKYATSEYQNTVVGIELLNEPLPERLAGGTAAVVQFSKDGYGKVREVGDTPVIASDAFQAGAFWNGVLEGDAKNVVIDHHQYQIFSNDELKRSPSEHVKAACDLAKSYSANANHVFVVGEWTGAMTDCAPALNGYGIGARYDGWYPSSSRIGSCDKINWIDTWDQTLKDNTRRYIEAQLDAYESTTQGWIFWTAKTEAAAEWDYFRLIDNQIFPQPLTARKFPSAC